MCEIKIAHVFKAYGTQQVLSDVSFTLNSNVPTCLMAPSGDGKTTLLRILLGLEKADAGTITLPTPCRWAVVFQEDRLMLHLDALSNLRFVLGKDWDEQKARTLLEELGLTDYEDKPVHSFSGGMKRRLALARALLAPADAVLLDEPFTGLDEESRTKAIACVKNRTANKIVLFTTHQATDAAALGANKILLQKEYHNEQT